MLFCQDGCKKFHALVGQLLLAGDCHYCVFYQTNPGAVVQVVRTSFKLHSKDGVTMTLLSMNTSSHQYAGVDAAGTFDIRISGDTVTISNGVGAGATFNGTWKEHR